jgi:DNA-binding transcriptional LysR family regulator
MRLTQIRDFLAVIESGSISATARKLGVSQPGLTKSLSSLEADLGAPLLKRTPSGVTLTRLGQAFHVHARAGYAELAKAQAVTHAAKPQVTLGFGPFFAAQTVPQAVMRFREKFPDVELRLQEGFAYATVPLVRDATLDMALAPRAPLIRDDPAIRFKPISHLNQIVVARRGHPCAKVRTAAALACEEWLCVTAREPTAELLRGLGVPEPRQITHCESFSAIYTLLAGTNMLAVVPHPFLGMPQVSQAIQEIPIAERLPGLTVGLYTRADAPLTKPAAALARLLSEIGRKVLQRGA